MASECIQKKNPFEARATILRFDYIFSLGNFSLFDVTNLFHIENAFLSCFSHFLCLTF